MIFKTGDNNFGVAKWIVDSVAGQGTHQTIAAALTDASSGETIFIRPGTYTENLTLKAGVDLASFSGEGRTPNVTIIGKLSASFAGRMTISGIRLQTNSDNFLSITGSSATFIALWNCYLNCTNATGISNSSSSSSSRVVTDYCHGDIGTTGISLFSHSGSGSLSFYYSSFSNSGVSTTDSTISGGSFESEYSLFGFGITTSGTVSYSTFHCSFTLSGQGTGINHTALTVGATGNHFSSHDQYFSGSSTAITVNTGPFLISNAVIASSNTNAISGSGTIDYDGLAFGSYSQKISTTTQVGGLLKGGQTQNPSAGFLGERIESSLGTGSISMSNNTPKTITSISLTAGIWDISSIASLSGTLTGTRFQSSISPTNNTLGSGGVGIDIADGPTMSTSAANVTQAIPNLRVVLTATTTYYLVANVIFSGGTATTGGTIRATRVG